MQLKVEIQCKIYTEKADYKYKSLIIIVVSIKRQ